MTSPSRPDASLNLEAKVTGWGIWCPEHALPHLFTAEIFSLSADGVTSFGVMEACHD